MNAIRVIFGCGVLVVAAAVGVVGTHAFADEEKVCKVDMLLKDDSCTYQYPVEGIAERDGERVINWSAVFSVREGLAHWKNNNGNVVSTSHGGTVVFGDDVCLGGRSHCGHGATFWAKPVEGNAWRIVDAP